MWITVWFWVERVFGLGNVGLDAGRDYKFALLDGQVDVGWDEVSVNFLPDFERCAEEFTRKLGIDKCR